MLICCVLYCRLDSDDDESDTGEVKTKSAAAVADSGDEEAASNKVSVRLIVISNQVYVDRASKIETLDLCQRRL